METITIEQAIEQGYKFAGYRDIDEQGIRDITKLRQSDFDEANEDSGPLVLCDLNPMHYTIDAKTIEELIVEHICVQDEMADEDCALGELASGADFEALANDINKRMAGKDFYNLTDIELLAPPNLTHPE